MSDQAQLEANKRLAREYIQRVFNEHRPDLSSEYVTDDVVWHGGILGDIAGAGNVSGLLSAFIGALPDLYAAEQDIVAENDLVTVRLVVKATQKGDLLGVPGQRHRDPVERRGYLPHPRRPHQRRVGRGRHRRDHEPARRVQPAVVRLSYHLGISIRGSTR